VLERRARAGGDGETAPAAGALDAPRPVTAQSVTLDLLQAGRAARFGQLGVAMPHHAFLPLKALQRSFRQTRRWQSGDTVAYAFPPGVLPLREQIARRLARAGCTVGPDRVQITSGAQEALSISLRALARPGDVVAVESPTYYGLLQCLHTLGLNAIEVPTDRDRGVSVPALAQALAQWPVRACVLVPNHGNPVGHAMSEADKRALAALLDETGTPLVEDDVYGEFGHHNPRPRTLQSYLRRSEWLLVGSASKSVSAGLRLGWLVGPAGRRQELEYLQYTQTTGASTLDQYALADYLARGGHDRHLRQVRAGYADLTRRMRDQLLTQFPQGTDVNQPAGGYLLWVTGRPALTPWTCTDVPSPKGSPSSRGRCSPPAADSPTASASTPRSPGTRTCEGRCRVWRNWPTGNSPEPAETGGCPAWRSADRPQPSPRSGP
jgi:DNA-binding transcriptional MocR family regulator